MVGRELKGIDFTDQRCESRYTTKGKNYITKAVESDYNYFNSQGTYFDFAFVFPENRPGDSYRMREIGVTCSGQRGADDSKTLSQANFQIGDYLDINITPANRTKEMRQDRGGRGRDDDNRMMDRMDRRRDDRDNDRRGRDRRDRPY